MTQYNIAEAKAHLSVLVRRALAGEEIVIARDNKPMLRLVPLKLAQGTRRPGSGKHKLVRMARDFNALLADFKDHV